MSVTHDTDTTYERNFAMVLVVVICSMMSGGLLLATVGIVARVSTVVVEFMIIIGCVAGFVIGMAFLYQRDLIK